MPTARRALIHLPETDSTSSHLKRLLAEGAPVGTAVLADCQTAGYGQRGRDWTSPVGSGMYLSVATGLPNPATVLPLAVGVAALAALEPWTREARLKWVNDLVARGRKLGGVLVEVVRGQAVVGVGINLATPPVEGAIGLDALAATPPTPLELAERLRLELDRWLGCWEAEGAEVVLAAWRASSVTLGREVQVDGRPGKALDVGPHGELLMEWPDGQVEAVLSGTVRAHDGSYCGPVT